MFVQRPHDDFSRSRVPRKLIADIHPPFVPLPRKVSFSLSLYDTPMHHSLVVLTFSIDHLCSPNCLRLIDPSILLFIHCGRSRKVPSRLPLLVAALSPTTPPRTSYQLFVRKLTRIFVIHSWLVCDARYPPPSNPFAFQRSFRAASQKVTNGMGAGQGPPLTAVGQPRCCPRLVYLSQVQVSKNGLARRDLVKSSKARGARQLYEEKATNLSQSSAS